MPDTKMDDALAILGGANACSEHRTDIEEKDLEEVLAAAYHEGDCAESNGIALVRLKNGQYAVIEEWEDTSGHG